MKDCTNPTEGQRQGRNKKKKSMIYGEQKLALQK